MKCKRCFKHFDTQTAEVNAEFYGNNCVACPHCGKAYNVKRVVKIVIEESKTQADEDDWGKPIVSDNDFTKELSLNYTLKFINPITKKMARKVIPKEFRGNNDFCFTFNKNNTRFLYVRKPNIETLKYLKYIPNRIPQWIEIFTNLR